MKQIIKGREPRSLSEHRARGGDFDGLPKDELREQLLNEQGRICCYCMRRIPKILKADEIQKNYPSSKIAHVLSQDNHPEHQLNYQNLLIACNGNHGQPKKTQTCDTFQGERDLSFNPADRTRNIENLIKYLPNGEIHSDDPLIDRELEEVLNLNTLDLRKIRAEFYKGVSEKIKEEGKGYAGKEIPKRFFEAEKQKLLIKSDGRFPEYCMIGVYLINKKLKKLN